MRLPNRGTAGARAEGFAPLGGLVVAGWIIAGGLFWWADVSELLVWYAGLFVVFAAVVELATGSVRLSVPDRIDAVVLFGFLGWTVLFVAFVGGWL